MASPASVDVGALGQHLDSEAVAEDDACPAADVDGDDDDDDGAAAAAELANLIDVIADHIEKDEFPPVNPRLQSAFTCSEAADIIAWIQKNEYVDIKSYIDQQYQSFRETNPGDLQISERVRRAQWSRDYFYVHVKNFHATQDRGFLIFEALKVMLDVEKLSSDDLTKLQNCCRAVKNGQQTDLCTFIAAEWTTLWDSLPHFAKFAEDSLKRQWLTENCVELLERFTHASEAFVFEPELKSSEIVDPIERARAEALVPRVTADHVRPIAEKVEDEYKESMAGLPDFARAALGSGSRVRFLLVRYYSIVASILDAASATALYTFMPAISIEDIEDDSKRVEATLVVSRVCPHHEPLILQAVNEALEADMAGLSGFNLESLGGAMRASWFKNKYFPVVASVLNRSENTGGASSNEPRSSIESTAKAADCTTPHMLVSPKKKVGRVVVL